MDLTKRIWNYLKIPLTKIIDQFLQRETGAFAPASQCMELDKKNEDFLYDQNSESVVLHKLILE